MTGSRPAVRGRKAPRPSLPVPPRYPSLYQINTRVWLRQLSDLVGRRLKLDDVPDSELDAIAAAGFDWGWLLSVWETGEAGKAVSRGRAAWREEFEHVLPDLRDDDICGSGFAVADYSVSKTLGGPKALASFRKRLAKRGIRLMLDFVPNHTALDHPWVLERPELYVEGTVDDLARAPENFVRMPTVRGTRILAHGRDPNFLGWPDTLQLNYGCQETRQAMRDALLTIAGQCDGVRCDMAMLILPEIFQKTWGVAMEPFWPGAIEEVRTAHPGFVFMAEVYWDMEWELQRQGFDYCYDKRFYDRLRDRQAPPVRAHLAADLGYQARLARFLENHDEPRAAAAFPDGAREAAAVATYFAPGLRFFLQGQREGARIRVPTHLCRGPEEPAVPAIARFHDRLLDALRREVFRNGAWQLLTPEPAWPGNPSHQVFLTYTWIGSDGRRVLVVINFSGQQAQCRIRIPFGDLSERMTTLQDLIGEETYERDATEMLGPGLYIDHGPWHYNVFDIQPGPASRRLEPR